MQTKYIYENVGLKPIRTRLRFILNFCRTAQHNRNPSDDIVPLLAGEKKRHSLNISGLHSERKIRVRIAKVSSILTFSEEDGKQNLLFFFFFLNWRDQITQFKAFKKNLVVLLISQDLWHTGEVQEAWKNLMLC